MSPEKYFSIIVKGKESSEAEEGNLNKSTGLPDGPTTKIKLQLGRIFIPNFSKVWAERVVDSKTKVPTGELKFLKWGEKGGEVVSLRYLEGVPSLDKHYQIHTLKIVHSEEENNETSFIELDLGINDFDVERADPMFIEFIKHHTYCGSNVSRKPGNKEIHYELYDPKTINQSKVDKMRQTKKAQDYIIDLENDTDKLVIYAKMFDLDPQAQNEVIFNELLEILEDSPERILKVIDHNRAKFKYQLDDLMDRGMLEITKDGDVIETVDEKREFIVKGLDVGGDVKTYLIENFMEPDVYPVLIRVSEVTDQLLSVLQ